MTKFVGEASGNGLRCGDPSSVDRLHDGAGGRVDPFRDQPLRLSRITEAVRQLDIENDAATRNARGSSPVRGYPGELLYTDLSHDCLDPALGYRSQALELFLLQVHVLDRSTSIEFDGFPSLGPRTGCTSGDRLDQRPELDRRP